MGQIESNGTRRRVLEPRWLCLLLRPARRRLEFGPVVVGGREHLRPCARRIRPSFPRPGWCQTQTALLPAPFWCTYTWNRPTSTGAGGSDPLWLCWRGKPWLAIRWPGYAAFKRSQLERQLILGPGAITNRDITASPLLIASSPKTNRIQPAPFNLPSEPHRSDST